MVDYLIPNKLSDVLECLDKEDSILISGGTDLMVQRRNWAELPASFSKKPIYIFNLEELKYIKTTSENIHIGACTPMSDILNHKDTPALLKESISIIASPALRNLATLPGNIMNASPAGDTLPILYALDAVAVVKSVKNTFLVPVNEIITGPRKTSLQANEMITEVIIPLTKFTTTEFVKVGGRKADAISKVSFTGAVNTVDKTINDIRIAFGAVGPTVVRIRGIEKQIVGLEIPLKEEEIKKIKNEYSKFVRPIDDQRSNKKYRHHVALNLLENFMKNLS